MQLKGEINVKKVILYGVGSVELRRDAEYFMDDEYEIVGYSDSHYSYDSLDGAAFYPPEALCHQPVDYAGVFADRRELFMDLIHLNTAGAEAFTQIVNRDVVSAMIYSHNSTMNP